MYSNVGEHYAHCEDGKKEKRDSELNGVRL